MAYLRIRNGYGYVCKKVKKEGQWKEETIVPLGKIKNEEDKKKNGMDSQNRGRKRGG